MHVCIYICWHLELSGNANLRLHQCRFAFTHRSPIKNFASCRLREKNFASLRLRKNLVESFARISFLVDKTTFQYGVLTIYRTTIDRHPPAPARRGGRGALDAPDHHQRPQPRWKGTPWTCRITTPAPAAVAEGDALDAPGSPPAPARRGVEGDALDVPDHHQHPHAAGWKGTPWTCRITPAPARRGVEGDALDLSDHPSARTPRVEGDALDAPGSHQRPQGWKGTRRITPRQSIKKRPIMAAF